ncbi:protein mono-ADP-ribosyltransferase PARP14-like [Haliotis asinina]|uniref:protein mono-ADP-ribosyltransferase PARP14-like n=1 Tax=Haliotis asinina TaxID=109174 RepID=UPI003531FB0D
MAEATDTSRDRSETEPVTDRIPEHIFSKAMLSFIEENEVSSEKAHVVYESISSEEEEEEEYNDMPKQPQKDEESPYLSLKTCLRECFRDDMRKMVESMRISQIVDMIKENKPPPLPPPRPDAKPKVIKTHQEDSDAPTENEPLAMLVMNNVDSNKLSYLEKSDTRRKRLTETLCRKHRAVIQWSNVTTDRIVALETKEGPRTSSQQDIQSWREGAESAIKGFLDDILVLNVPLIPRTRAKIENIPNPNPDEVKIELSDDRVILTGSHTRVPQVAEDIMELVRKIEGDMDREMPHVAHQQLVVELKPWQFRYLQIMKCSECLKNKHQCLTVEVNPEVGTLTISGQGTDILAARIEIEEILGKVRSSTLPNVQKILLFAFTRDEFLNYIQCKLAAKDLHAVIEVLSDKLWIHASDSATVSAASTMITESVKMTYLKTDMLTQGKWKKLIEDIRQRVKEPFIIDRLNDGKPAVMACAAEVQDTVMKMLVEAAERSSVHERKLIFEKGIFLAITRCCSSAIETIKAKYEIDVSFDHASFMVRVVGPRSQLSSAIGELQSLSDDVVVKYSRLDKPGALEFLKSPSGNNMIKRTEDAHVCVVDIEEDTPPIGAKSKDEAGNILKAKVTVVKGDITKQLVDVIVISVGRNSIHVDGSLLKAVSEAAGAAMQKKHKKKSFTDVSYGQLTVTSGGKLKCKSVFHCCIPAWEKVKGDIKVFQKAVMSCLETANVSNYTSIAFPAMGCGGLGYPPHLAAKALFDAFSMFEKKTKSGLQEINIVIYDTEEKIYKIFENERNNRLLGTVKRTKDVGAVNVQGVEITVKVGELSKTKADVIVNTTNKGLRLNQGAVSMAILTEGGYTIQNECNIRYRKGIEFGDVVETGGGNLRCKSVYHTCLPKWDDSSNALQALTKTVDTCLQRAPSRGYETIAFPALGTGILQYPPEIVARVFKEKIAAFSTDNPLTCLREVIIVLYLKDEKTTKAFNEAFDSDPSVIRELPTTNDRMKSKEFWMGPLRVELKVGTLRTEKVNTIVVPTDNKVSLRGQVACLKSEFGPDCMVGSDRANMSKSGAVVVPAQNMSCTNVMLVSTEYFKNNVEEMIKKCFRKADKEKIMSLAIGHDISEEQDADARLFATGMERAINRYKKQLKVLSDVRVVLSNAEQKFTCDSIFRQNVGRPAKTRSFVLSDEDGLSSSSTPQRYRSMSSGDPCLLPLPRLHLLAMAKEHLENCMDTISAILQQNVVTEILTHPAMGTLPDDKVSHVISLCADLHVLAQVDNEMVHFHGSKEDVMAAKRKTQEFVQSIIAKHQTRERAETIQINVQWYMIPPGEERKAFPPVSNMLLEQAYQAGLPSATFKHSGWTVTADFRTSRFHVSPTQSFGMSRDEMRAA